MPGHCDNCGYYAQIRIEGECRACAMRVKSNNRQRTLMGTGLRNGGHSDE